MWYKDKLYLTCFISLAVCRNSGLGYSCTINSSLIFNFHRYIWQQFGNILQLVTTKISFKPDNTICCFVAHKIQYYINYIVKENIFRNLSSVIFYLIPTICIKYSFWWHISKASVFMDVCLKFQLKWMHICTFEWDVYWRGVDLCSYAAFQFI